MLIRCIVTAQPGVATAGLEVHLGTGKVVPVGEFESVERAVAMANIGLRRRAPDKPLSWVSEWVESEGHP